MDNPENQSDAPSGAEAPSPEALQFDVVEPAEPSADDEPTACTICKATLTASYYTLNQQVVCGGCHQAVKAHFYGPLGTGRFLRAALFGLGAAVLGSVIWLVVTKATGYQLGIIALVVGFLVGTAVRKGASSRGGPALQVLAIGLTYLSIVGSYVPEIYEQVQSSSPTEQAEQAEPTEATKIDAPAQAPAPSRASSGHSLLISAAIVFVVACMAPFLGGAQNLIGLLIIGFALYEAWKLNKRPELATSGPHPLVLPHHAP